MRKTSINENLSKRKEGSGPSKQDAPAPILTKSQREQKLNETLKRAAEERFSGERAYLEKRRAGIADTPTVIHEVRERLTSLKPVTAPSAAFWQSLRHIEEFTQRREAKKALGNIQTILDQFEEGTKHGMAQMLKDREYERLLSTLEEKKNELADDALDGGEQSKASKERNRMTYLSDALSVQRAAERARQQRTISFEDDDEEEGETEMDLNVILQKDDRRMAERHKQELERTKSMFESTKKKIHDLVKEYEGSADSRDDLLFSLQDWMVHHDRESTDFDIFYRHGITLSGEQVNNNSLSPEEEREALLQSAQSSLEEAKSIQRARVHDLSELYRMTFEEISHFGPEKFRSMATVYYSQVAEIKNLVKDNRDTLDKLRDTEKQLFIANKLAEKKENQLVILKHKLEKEQQKVNDLLDATGKSREPADPVVDSIATDESSAMLPPMRSDEEDAATLGKLFDLEATIQDLKKVEEKQGALIQQLQEELSGAKDTVKSLQSEKNHLEEDLAAAQENLKSQRMATSMAKVAGIARMRLKERRLKEKIEQSGGVLEESEGEQKQEQQQTEGETAQPPDAQGTAGAVVTPISSSDSNSAVPQAPPAAAPQTTAPIITKQTPQQPQPSPQPPPPAAPISGGSNGSSGKQMAPVSAAKAFEKMDNVTKREFVASMLYGLKRLMKSLQLKNKQISALHRCIKDWQDKTEGVCREFAKVQGECDSLRSSYRVSGLQGVIESMDGLAEKLAAKAEYLVTLYKDEDEVLSQTGQDMRSPEERQQDIKDHMEETIDEHIKGIEDRLTPIRDGARNFQDFVRFEELARARGLRGHANAEEGEERPEMDPSDKEKLGLMVHAERMEKEYKAAEQRVVRLKNEAQTLKSTATVAKKNIEQKYAQQVAELKAKNEALKNEVKDLAEVKETLSHDLLRTGSLLEQATQRSLQLEAALIEAQQANKEHDSKIEELKDRFKEKEDYNDKTIAKLREQLQVLSEAAESEGDTLEREKTNLMGQISNLTFALEKARADLSVLGASSSDLQHKYEQLVESSGTLQHQLAEKDGRISALQILVTQSHKDGGDHSDGTKGPVLITDVATTDGSNGGGGEEAVMGSNEWKSVQEMARLLHQSVLELGSLLNAKLGIDLFLSEPESDTLVKLVETDQFMLGTWVDYLSPVNQLPTLATLDLSSLPIPVSRAPSRRPSTALSSPKPVSREVQEAMEGELKQRVEEEVRTNMESLRSRNSELALRVNSLEGIIRTLEEQKALLSTDLQRETEALLARERELKEQKASVDFHRMSVKANLRRIEKNLKEMPSAAGEGEEVMDTMARALKRMAEREKARLEKWEKKKAEILAEREKVYSKIFRLVGESLLPVLAVTTRALGMRASSARVVYSPTRTSISYVQPAASPISRPQSSSGFSHIPLQAPTPQNFPAHRSFFQTTMSATFSSLSDTLMIGSLAPDRSDMSSPPLGATGGGSGQLAFLDASTRGFGETPDNPMKKAAPAQDFLQNYLADKHREKLEVQGSPSRPQTSQKQQRSKATASPSHATIFEPSSGTPTSAAAKRPATSMGVSRDRPTADRSIATRAALMQLRKSSDLIEFPRPQTAAGFLPPATTSPSPEFHPSSSSIAPIKSLALASDAQQDDQTQTHQKLHKSSSEGHVLTQGASGSRPPSVNGRTAASKIRSAERAEQMLTRSLDGERWSSLGIDSRSSPANFGRTSPIPSSKLSKSHQSATGPPSEAAPIPTSAQTQKAATATLLNVSSLGFHLPSPQLSSRQSSALPSASPTPRLPSLKK